MGKFYEYINSKLNQLREAQEKEKNNDYEAKEINYANKTFTNVCIVNKAIAILNKQKNVAGAVINNAASIVYDYNNNKIPPVSFGKDGVIIPKNLDTVISIIDERLNDNQIKEIVDELAEYKLPEEVEHVKFLENDVNVLENNTAELNLGEEELNEYKDALNYAKDNLTKLEEGGTSYEPLYNYITAKGQKETMDTFKKKIEDNNLEFEKIKGNGSTPNFSLANNVKKDIENVFGNDEFKTSPENQNKILNIYNFAEQQGLLGDGQGGESSFKNYAFTEYFKKAEAASKAIKDQRKNNTAENARKVINAVKELKEVENKYDKVIDYINKNVDFKKVVISDNIYSGRPDSTNLLKNPRPDLPKKWDGLNLEAGVVLNGLAQLKNAAKLSNMKVEDIIKNPNKLSENLINENREKFFETRVIKKEDAPLGIRMARAFNNGFYVNGQSKGLNLGRAQEFITGLDENKDNVINNKINNTYQNYSVSVKNPTPNAYLYGDDKNLNYSSGFKNFFKLGNEVDNLFELCPHYNDEEKGEVVIIEPNLNDNPNTPAEELNKVIKIITDFIIESENIAERNPLASRTINYTGLMLSAKSYMQEYMEAKNYEYNLDDKLLRTFLTDPRKVINDSIKKELANDPAKAERINNNLGNDCVKAYDEYQNLEPEAVELNKEKLEDSYIKEFENVTGNLEDKYNKIMNSLLKYNEDYIDALDSGAKEEMLPLREDILSHAREALITHVCNNHQHQSDAAFEKITKFIEDPGREFIHYVDAKYQQQKHNLPEDSVERRTINNYINKLSEDMNDIVSNVEQKIVEDGAHGADRWKSHLEGDMNRFVDKFNIHNTGRTQNMTINQSINANKGGFWERFFRSTSDEYKDFVEALKGYNDPNSDHYCKLNELRAAGVAYIKHKLPNVDDVLNVDTSRLGSTAKNRISFIQNVLNTVEDLRRDPAMPEGEEPIIDNERENIVIEDANELDNDNLIDEIKEDININIENAKDDEEIEFK